MSLITDNQRKTAQEPEPTTPPLPKPQQPARLQEYDLMPEFEQGQGDLGFATEEQLGGEPELAPTLEAGQEIEFAAPGVGVGESVVGLTQYLGDTLGSSVPVVIPNTPAASTPPMTNLWKDATVDLGLPNLRDPRIATASYPTNYNDGFSTFDPGVGGTFAQAANATARADQQEQARTNANLAKLAQLQQQARGSLPNVPDASKPWHEQLWGWAGDFLQGTEQERATEDRTGKGTFGAYGSGLGGFFKATFGVPIATATAAYLETWGREEYNKQKRILRASNPTVRTTSEDGKSSLEKPFMSLTQEEQHRYLTERVSDNLPLGAGALVRTNVDFRKGFGTYLYQALAGEKDDSINDANPTLAPVIDKRTGKPAEAKPAKGFFQSANLRPGQQWYDDPAGSALGLATQLFSPGNKVDAAGEILGLGLRALSRTNIGKAAGRAIANAVPKPVKQGARAVAGAAKRTVQGIQTNTFGSAPISNPTPIVGVPVNRGTEFQNFLNNQAQLARGNSSAPTKLYVPPTKAEDPEVLEGMAAWRRRNLGYVAPPVVPGVPAFNPAQTPFLPKTDPEGTAAVVGIGQKGQPLQFEPTVGLRTHTELVQQVLNQNPEKFGSYRGNSWEEWEVWKKANLSEEDLRQLEAVGAVRESSTTTLQTNTRLQLEPTLDDLQTQARVLAEQKLSVEAPLKQLEEVFDETVDVGRRSVDELPLKPLTEADVAKAIEYEAGIRLSRQLPASIVEAAARGDTKALIAQAEALGGMQTLLQQHNTALQDLSPRVTPEVAAVERVAADLPKQVYHGTALAQWQPYNVIETGSRGELGSALYTTRTYEEAAEYAKASVGNNRPVEIAYEPLAPQVVVLDTSKLVAPLDASVELPESLIRRLAGNFTQELPQTSALTYTDVIRAVETGSAKAGGSEELLQKVNDSVSDVLRAEGYDSVYDPRSGWLAVIDNGKLDVVKQESFSPPSAIQAAVARYNADSIAAGHFPENVTSDANLRDSAYQLLDQTRNSLDEKLEEVTQQLQEATYKEELKPLAQQAQEQSFDTLRARAKEPPSVERYKRDIQEFGQPLHPPLLRELPYNPRTDRVEFEVIGNFEAYDAAVASYDAKSYSMVGAMVAGTKERVAGMSAGESYYLVDIKAIRKKTASPVKLPTTKEEVIAGFNPKNPVFTPTPVVLEQTSFETFRVLDRGFTANAYSTLYKQGERSAEMVPAMVIGKDGKVEFFLVDLAAIEKKAKALEPSVPKAEELTQAKPTRKQMLEALKALEDEQGVVRADFTKRASENAKSAEKRGFSAIDIERELGLTTDSYSIQRGAYKEAKARGDELTYEDHYKGIYADLKLKTKKDLEAIAKANGTTADDIEGLANKLAMREIENKPTMSQAEAEARVQQLEPPPVKQTLLQLKEEAAALGLPKKGTKAQLQAAIERAKAIDAVEDFPFDFQPYIDVVYKGGRPGAESAEIQRIINSVPEELRAPFKKKLIETKNLYASKTSEGESLSLPGYSGKHSFQSIYKEVAYDAGYISPTVAVPSALGSTVETSFGSLTAAPENLAKAQELLSSIESRLSSLGLPTVKVPKIVYVDEAVDAKALQQFVGAQDPIPLAGMYGAYSGKLDALVVNGNQPLDLLEPAIVHELMHAFEARLPDEAIDAFRDFIRKSALSKYAPSEYSLKDKGEFMAETAVAVLFGKNKLTTREIPDNLKQEFTKAWQAAAAFLQDKPLQKYEKLSEMIDKLMLDEMPSYAKDVQSVIDSMAELRKQRQDLKQFMAQFEKPDEEAFVEPPLQANPHASTREALDEANNGTHDICNL